MTLLPWPAKKSSTSSVLEDFTDTLTRPSRALEVVLGVDLLSDRHALNNRNVRQ